MNFTNASDRILFTLCYANLLRVKALTERHPFRPTQAETIAQITMCETLFELASGAAVRQKFKRGTTDMLVNLMEDIKIAFEWNIVDQ